MNKMNKKGFTLIEMLVVIAIIAVLVAIIIPTVSSATGKAAAATNAANLRSMVAEATNKHLSADTTSTGNVTVSITTAEDGTKTISASVTSSAPKSKECGNLAKDQAATLYWDNTNKTFVASYNGYSLAALTAVADGTVTPDAMAPDCSTETGAPLTGGNGGNNGGDNGGNNGGDNGQTPVTPETP